MIPFITGLILVLVLIPQDAHAYTIAVWVGVWAAAYVGANILATAIGFAAAALVYVGASVALSVIGKALTGGSADGLGASSSMATSAQATKETSTRGQLINTTDSQVALPLIYGRQRVGINRVYIGTSGTSNKYLHIVGTLCEGPIEGVASIDGVYQIYLNDKIYTEYGANFAWEIFNGTSTQTVCTTLQTAIPAWTDPLKYTAYIYCVFEFNPDVFSSVPEITVVLDGLKVYNPATTVTAYSDKPALCARDFMIRRSCRGGMEIAAARIDDTLVNSCASYCTTKGWTCNICILENNAVVDNLSQILSCFRGDVIYSGTNFKMKYTDLNYESSVMDIDEDDIIEVNGTSTFKIVQPDIFGTPNAIRMKFYNSDKLWQIDDYVLSDSDAITADGDYREKEIYVRGVNNLEDAQKMANYNLERLRYNKTISFVMGSRGIRLEPYDIFRVTYAAFGWSLKLFRVMLTTVSQTGEVAVTAVEELSTMYDDVYNPSVTQWDDTNLPSILDTIPSVGNVSLAEEVYYYRKRSYTRLVCTFTPPSAETYPQWSYADVYVKIGSGDWKFYTKAVSSYILDPVEEGETYSICLVSCTTYGSKQAFTSGVTVSKTILGASATPPTSISGVSVAVTGNSVKIYAPTLEDPDIAFYEVRSGTTWAGGVLVGRSVSSIIYLPGVRPGTYTFWMNTCDTSGMYGETPRSTTCTVYQPIAETLENEWTWDFSTGTDSNTEQVTHDPAGDNFNALKCSHTGDVLTGFWTSVEYDLGSIKQARIEGDFLTHFHAGTATWANTLGSKTWAEWGADTKTWRALFDMDGSDALSAVLYYGETSPPASSQAISAVLSPTVSARYVKVIVTITDPVLDANLYLKDLNMKAYAS